MDMAKKGQGGTDEEEKQIESKDRGRNDRKW